MSNRMYRVYRKGKFLFGSSDLATCERNVKALFNRRVVSFSILSGHQENGLNIINLELIGN